MKKLVAILLVCCMIIPFGMIAGVMPMADSATKTVYISDDGDDTNEGDTTVTAVKTLAKAYEILGNDGGIVEIVGVCSMTSHFVAPDHTGKITVRGHDSASKLVISGGTRRYQSGGPLEFANIIIEQSSTMMLVGGFHPLTIASTVTHNKLNGDSHIVAGGQGGKVTGSDRDYTPADTTLTINAGTWSEVIGSYRSSLNSFSGTKTADDFKNYTVTINIGGNAVINRLATFSRLANNSEFVAEGAKCIVNLNGGVVSGWICQSDTRKSNSKNGYGEGMTVYIGKNFDFEGSFTLDAAKQNSNHIVTDSGSNEIFYGFSGDNVFLNHDKNPIGKSTVVIAPELYDSIKDSTRLRGFAAITKGDGAAPDTDAPETDAPDTDAPDTDAPETDAPDTDAPGEDLPPEEDNASEVVYLSDSGSDSNSGVTADKPFKTLTKCYATLSKTKGGAIVIVGEFAPIGHFAAPLHTGKVTIRGNDEDAKYVIEGATRRFHLGGPTEFTDITIEQNKDMLFIGRFNDFTISSTVNHVKNGGNAFIVGGGQGGTGKKPTDTDYTPKSYTLTVNAGQWNDIMGSIRGSLSSPSGDRTAAEFANYLVTINIGGTASIGKLAAFSRSIDKAQILAKNSQCVVNLDGGKITHWFGMSESTAPGQNGYENGIIINIGEGFDLSQSFQGDISAQKNNIVSNLFYGFNGDNVRTGGYGAIGQSIVYIAEAKYDEYKGSDRFRDVKIKKGAYTAELPEAPEGEVEPEKTVYLSDSGSNENDGLTAETPVKTLKKAYQLLGNNGGTVIITDTYTPTGHFISPTHAGKITIKGLTQSSKYLVEGKIHHFMAGGPTEWTDVTIEQDMNLLMVANYNVFTITSTVKHTRKSGTAIIVAGGQGIGGTITESDTRGYLVRSTAVTVNAGRWSEIIGSIKTGLKSPNKVTHKQTEFRNYSVVINIGGTAVVGKIAAFSRNYGITFIAQNSECVVNLNGGQVTHWMGMSDSSKTAKHGYGNGMIVNIGPGFDFENSFQASKDSQVNNVVNNVFYGISGNSVFMDKTYGKLNTSKVYIHPTQYEALKNSDKFREVKIIEGVFTDARAPQTGDSRMWACVTISLMAVAVCTAGIVIGKSKRTAKRNAQ